jgi:hypothetical protein
MSYVIYVMSYMSFPQRCLEEEVGRQEQLAVGLVAGLHRGQLVGQLALAGEQDMLPLLQLMHLILMKLTVPEPLLVVVSPAGPTGLPG